MKIQTFVPAYLPTEKQGRATKPTTSQSSEPYCRIKVRADLVEKLSAIKPDGKTMTVFLNNALASFLNNRKTKSNTNEL
jgi:hypothetical protein